jgi:nitroreductase
LPDSNKFFPLAFSNLQEKTMNTSRVVLFFLAVTVFSAADCNAKDALSVIHSRKSVRHYSGKPVSKDDLTTLLKAGMAAPTARNQQPWVFIAVTNEDALLALAKGLPYTKMIVKSRACIVVCGDMDKALPGKEQDFWIQDCSAASENILLAAEAMGLGAVWSGMYPLEERVAHVRKVLGLPDNIIPLNVIAVGHPSGIDKPHSKYDPKNIHWQAW